MRAAAVAALLLHAPRANATNTTFVRGPEGLNYPEAEAFCTEIGATIASIRSAAENELARTACGGATCWIGLEEIGGNAWTPKASQTWRWVDGSDATYTNWMGTEPNNHDGNDERNAIMNCCEGVEGVALTDTGGWYDVTEGYDQPKPLCRLVGELSFDLVHVPAQCQERCWPKEGKQNEDKDCCTFEGKMSCVDDSLGGKYQLVRTERVCHDHEGDRQAYNYYCLPCKAGAVCDNGRGDDEKGCPDHSGWVVFVIFLFVILPLCCIGCSVAACCFACQQNNRRPQARVQQQPVAYAAAQPAGGAVQMQQYGKQPYQTGPPQAPYVQPTVVQPCVDIKFYSTFVLILRVNLHAIDAPLRWRGDADGRAIAEHPTHWLPHRSSQRSCSPRLSNPLLYNPLSYNPLSYREVYRARSYREVYRARSYRAQSSRARLSKVRCSGNTK